MGEIRILVQKLGNVTPRKKMQLSKIVKSLQKPSKNRRLLSLNDLTILLICKIGTRRLGYELTRVRVDHVPAQDKLVLCVSAYYMHILKIVEF